MKHIRTEKGLFGELIHYSEENGYEGVSVPGLIPGTYDHYTPDQGYVGHSDPGILSDMMHYNENGLQGVSSPGLIAGENHYSFEDGLIGQSFGDDFGADTYLDE